MSVKTTRVVSSTRILPNPKRLGGFIGGRPCVYSSSGRRYMTGGRLHAGPGPRGFTLVTAAPLTSCPPLGTVVVRVDYDNSGKALRAYGRLGRFRHDFISKPRVSFVHREGGKTFIIITAGAVLWRKQ